MNQELQLKILIFCEGITDLLFIADCIELFYKINTTRPVKKGNETTVEISFDNGQRKGKIIGVGGCSKLRNQDMHTDQMKDNTELGGDNIVFFDADFPKEHDGSKENTGNHGKTACQQKLDAIKKDKECEFDYYIWPNNQDEVGEIENLLRKLVQYEDVISCIENHQNCLKNTSIPKKIKIETELKRIVELYLYTVKQNSKPSERTYQSEFWNLSTDTSGAEDLIKLKNFLDKYFK